MKKTKIAFIKLAIILSTVVIINAVLFINSYKESKEEVNNFSEIISYHDLINLIGFDLQEKGYEEITLNYTILPDENVEIVIILADENMDDNIQEKVQQIAIDDIIANNFDPQFFQITITNFTTM